MRRLTFFYPPTLNWERMFQRPQQIARALGALGHRFYFCQKFPSDETEPDEIVKNVFIVNQDWEQALDSVKPDVIFSSWAKFHDLKGRAPLLIYDCLDDFPDWRAYEAKMIQAADVILATSELNKARMESHGKPVTMVRNGAADDDFGTASQLLRPSGMIGRHGIKVVFSGFFGSWVDVTLFAALMDHRPDITFVIAGHGPCIDRLVGKPNVVCLGELMYSMLPKVISECDVGIIPFSVGCQIAEAADPIKTYEYIASGLPVVATPIREMARFEAAGVVVTAGTVEEMSRAIDTVAPSRRNVADLVVRRRFAHENSWTERAKTIESVLMGALS